MNNYCSTALFILKQKYFWNVKIQKGRMMRRMSDLMSYPKFIMIWWNKLIQGYACNMSAADLNETILMGLKCKHYFIEASVEGSIEERFLTGGIS